MSFWKRTILGGNIPLDNLPNSNAATPTVKTDDSSPPPRPKAAASITEQSAAAGPPPISTAYTNPSSPPRVVPSQKSPRKERAVPPPTFHIFEPKQETTHSHTDKAMEDQTPVDSDGNSAGSMDEEETSQICNLEESMAETFSVAEDTHTQHDDNVDNDISTPMQPECAHDDDDYDCGSSSKDQEKDESQNSLSEFNAPAIPDDDPEESLVTPSQTLQETALVPHESPVAQETTPLSPKFDFLNDSVPLRQLEDSASKRRHESQLRIHQLDCELASLQAKLAHASMDCAKAMPTLNNLVNQPLESLVEKFGNQLLSPPPDGHLHARLAKLEASRMRHMHVELPNALADELESPFHDVTLEIKSCLRLETSKADKRIGTLVRRFETIAGAVARRHFEEAASRRAALIQVQSLAQDAANLDEQRARQFLDSLEALRISLQREREERIARDEKVMALIVERTTELKRALLEAAGST
jgi:hypothetical protein